MHGGLVVAHGDVDLERTQVDRRQLQRSRRFAGAHHRREPVAEVVRPARIANMRGQRRGFDALGGAWRVACANSSAGPLMRIPGGRIDRRRAPRWQCRHCLESAGPRCACRRRMACARSSAVPARPCAPAVAPAGRRRHRRRSERGVAAEAVRSHRRRRLLRHVAAAPRETTARHRATLSASSAADPRRNLRAESDSSHAFERRCQLRGRARSRCLSLQRLQSPATRRTRRCRRYPRTRRARRGAAAGFGALQGDIGNHDLLSRLKSELLGQFIAFASIATVFVAARASVCQRSASVPHDLRALRSLAPGCEQHVACGARRAPFRSTWRCATSASPSRARNAWNSRTPEISTPPAGTPPCRELLFVFAAVSDLSATSFCSASLWRCAPLPPGAPRVRVRCDPPPVGRCRGGRRASCGTALAGGVSLVANNCASARRLSALSNTLLDVLRAGISASWATWRWPHRRADRCRADRRRC